MARPAYAHDALLPQPPGGTAPGIALALLAHAGLLLALTTVVDWRTQSPEVVAAELWASVPQTAAPKPDSAVPPSAPKPAPVPPAPPPPAPTPPVPPPPKPVPVPAPPPPAVKPPPEPDIAAERTEQRRKAEAAKREAEVEAERERLAETKRKQAADAERTRREAAEREAQAEREAKAKAEEERVAKQREENLRRMMSQAGTGSDTRGTAAADAAPTANYLALLRKRVYDNLVFTGAVDDAARTEIEVRTAPSGTIISAKLVKASGHPQWDEAVMRAIDKTGRLPADANGRVLPSMVLVFRPRE